jgi:F0F1-type ATP synthase assembly protein I
MPRIIMRASLALLFGQVRMSTPPEPPEEDFVAEYRRREAAQRESMSWHRMAGSAGEFAGGVLAGALLGWASDHWLGTGPWGIIVGTLVGFGIGMFGLVKLSREAFR